MTKDKAANPHIGSSLDDFLREEGFIPQWQPIATAPKGPRADLGDLGSDMGPNIDLFAGGYRRTDCFWSHSDGDWVQRVRYVTRSGARKTLIIGLLNVTHWMPIPADPES